MPHLPKVVYNNFYMYFSVIKNSGFRFLWTNQILVQLAYNSLNFALIIWVFKLMDTNLAISALLLAIYTPSLLFGLFSGVLIDLVDKRKLILIVDILIALFFACFLLVKQYYILILINTFIINTLAQLFLPAESSSIPLLVSKKQLFLANSLFSITLYASMMVGYSLGGPILNHYGINAVFIFGTVLLMIAFFLSQRLPVIKSSKANKKISNLNFSELKGWVISEIKESLEFIKGKIEVTTSIGLLVAVQGVVGGLIVLAPAYLERVLKIHATDASYFLTIPIGLGMVVGAFVIGKFFHNKPRRSLVIPAIIGGGILLILIGVIPAIATFLQSADLPTQITRPRYFFRAPSLASIFGIVAFLMGLCMVAIIVPSQTVLQLNTKEYNRGKIFAVLAALMTAFSAIPVILAGILSDLFGVTPIFIFLGVVVLIVGLIALRPNLFFKEEHLSTRVREFLGLGHWQDHQTLT